MLFVYDLIEELCVKNNINVTKLCKDCKIPRSTLTDYKKGRVKPFPPIPFAKLPITSALA